MFEKFCMGLLFWVSFGACAQQILCLKSADEGVGRLQVRLPPVDRKTGDVLLEKNGETFVIYRKREAVEEKGPPATVVQFFLIFVNGKPYGEFRLTTRGSYLGEASIFLNGGSIVGLFDDQGSQARNGCDWGHK